MISPQLFSGLRDSFECVVVNLPQRVFARGDQGGA